MSKYKLLGETFTEKEFGEVIEVMGDIHPILAMLAFALTSVVEYIANKDDTR